MLAYTLCCVLSTNIQKLESLFGSVLQDGLCPLLQRWAPKALYRYSNNATLHFFVIKKCFNTVKQRYRF
jgi:hypothetical protein